MDLPTDLAGGGGRTTQDTCCGKKDGECQAVFGCNLKVSVRRRTRLRLPRPPLANAFLPGGQGGTGGITPK